MAMKRMGVLRIGLAVAIGGAGTAYFTGDPSSPPPLLSILSPPGAGYDSTNVALGTGSGAAVTVSRASTQTCEISAGVLTSVASSKPCVESGSLKVEPSGTNLLLQSDDLTNAAWINFNGTPTRTANTWDYGFGLIGDTISESDAALAVGVAQSGSTFAAGTYTFSCYLQAGTANAAQLFVETDGTGGSGCNVSLTSSTTRGSCTATIGGAPTRVRGVVFVGNVAATTGSIKVGGCQLETGSVATSYMATAGTAPSPNRQAQTTTVPKPAGLSTTEGSAKVCVTPLGWSTTAPQEVRFLVGETSTTAQLAYGTVGSGVFAASAGATVATVGGGYSSGVRKCYRTSWSATRSQLKVENITDGTVGTPQAFSGFASLNANVFIGSSATGINQALAKLDGICLSASPDGCR